MNDFRVLREYPDGSIRAIHHWGSGSQVLEFPDRDAYRRFVAAADVANVRALQRWRECRSISAAAFVLVRCGEWFEAFGQDAQLLAKCGERLRDCHGWPMVAIHRDRLLSVIGSLIATGRRVLIADEAPSVARSETTLAGASGAV